MVLMLLAFDDEREQILSDIESLTKLLSEDEKQHIKDNMALAEIADDDQEGVNSFSEEAHEIVIDALRSHRRW